MATDADFPPEELDFSNLQAPLPDDHWFPHLLLTFLVILICRVARSLGIVNLCHRWIVYLSTIITAEGRRRRTDRQAWATELTDLRKKLKGMSMADNFAQYSRCERRIKLLERQLADTRPESMSLSVIRTVSINVVLFIFEGILLAWLLTKTPEKTVSDVTLEVAEIQGARFLSILQWLQYLPAKVMMLIWIALCNSVANLIASWVSSFNTRPVEDTNNPGLDSEASTSM